MALFRYFQKAERSLNEHFQEVTNDESSNTGLSRFKSESVAETLKEVKSGYDLKNSNSLRTTERRAADVSTENPSPYQMA